jgi:diguanylate cyclase (GGDEF)-like protein
VGSFALLALRRTRGPIDVIDATFCVVCDHETQLLSALQNDGLKAIARGRTLDEVMSELCLRVEQLASGVVCSVLTVDGGQKLRHLAAPSLPSHYCNAIDGLAIGPSVGSCGTAAFLGEPVEVLDIASDPLWTGFRDLALPLGLLGCWSSPIMGSDGGVLGTFAIYYREKRGPSAWERCIVSACTDLCSIAIEHEETRKSLHRFAFFDSVTGLPNRVAFQQKVSEWLAAGPEPGCEIAVFSIDLDDFKKVNDTLGHLAGDDLLEQVAKRLSAQLSPPQMIARIGGDEFAVCLPAARSLDELRALAETLLDELDKPFSLSGRTTRISASIGIARAPIDGSDLGALMKCADVSLYAAKAAGRRQYRLFDAAARRRRAQRRKTQEELRAALLNEEFEVFFQPVVDLRTGVAQGFEALVRWRHAQRGLVPPMDFIPLAEKHGLIQEIGKLVLKKACAEAARWPAHLGVAVNLSPPQLQSPGFALTVARTLETAGLAPKRLELEITESVLLEKDPATLNNLRNLRELGVPVAIDDFGAGYSALSYLSDFTVDRLKIDRSFVANLGDKADARAIVRAIIGLASELGVKTTAEGVETEQQRSWLRAAGCDDAQGFLFSRPKPIQELEAFLLAPGRRAALSL